MTVRFFGEYPVVEPQHDLPAFVSFMCASGVGDFCLSTNFEPEFVGRLLSEGFLTISDQFGPGQYLLMPKLHEERCVLFPAKLHIHKKTRKIASTYRMTADTAFDRVVAGCHAQHGVNWLYPPVVAAFKALVGPIRGSRARVHSVEVWKGDTLVAGELGFRVGTCYTSLSGFRTEKGSGSVQLMALGAFLFEGLRCDLWDLGMALDYKYALGAEVIPRQTFLEVFRSCRATSASPPFTVDPSLTCRELIDRYRVMTRPAPPPPRSECPAQQAVREASRQVRA